MTGDRRLRLGMVGGGEGAFIGAIHRMAARLDDRWTLVAGAFSGDPDRSCDFGLGLGLAPERCHGDYLALAADRDAALDAVAVVTPNHLHHPICKAFLTAGVAVVCDKPLATTLADALDIAAIVEATGVPLIVTHTYAGYPMVRQARAMVAAGAVGRVRVIQVEYAQDWLSTSLEAGNRQAAWRTDPARAGPGGSLGDIGTHAFHLAAYVTGLTATALAADLARFGPGRTLDDNAHLLLRFDGGVRGMLWCSQVAVGNANALRLRVYGERGGLEWAQETPEVLRHTPLGEPARLIRRGDPNLDPAATCATRLPAGHPEGYLEAFAQLYADAAEVVGAWREGRAPDPSAALVPGVADGVAGVRFVEAAVASDRNGGAWTPLDPGVTG